MRRARHKLQVSTFPFLAVLLAAMGALILLLLVMDRRAKIVARNKARDAYEAAQARKTELTAADEEARRAEWERQRRALHALLEKEEAALREELSVAQSRMEEKQTGIDKEEARLAALEQRLKSEKEGLQKRDQALADIRSRLGKLDQSTGSSRSELDKLTRDLVQLEKVLAHLTALRKQAPETYSLVPYRGKQGEGRRPIYVECTPIGILFHPERDLIEAPHTQVQRVREEVQRRGAKLVRETREPRGDKPARPMPRESDQPYVLFLVRPNGIENFYRAQSALKGFDLDFGYEFIDAAWTLDFSGNGQAAGVSPLLRSPGTEVRGQETGVRGQETGVRNQGTNVVAKGNAGAPGEPRPLSPSVTGIPVKGMPSVGLPNVGPPNARPPSAAPLAKGTQSDVNWRGSDGKPTTTAKPPQEKPPVEKPPTIAEGTEKTVEADKVTEKGPPLPKGDAGPSDPLGRLAAPVLATGPVKPPPPSIGRLLGNRDYVITLECFDDAVTLLPGGRTFTLAGAASQASDQAIVQSVLQMIERRQATVRPGETPYRPMLRFQVHPEGRRTYYRVYPLFDKLRLPMIRENIEN